MDEEIQTCSCYIFLCTKREQVTYTRFIGFQQWRSGLFRSPRCRDLGADLLSLLTAELEKAA